MLAKMSRQNDHAISIALRLGRIHILLVFVLHSEEGSPVTNEFTFQHVQIQMTLSITFYVSTFPVC